MTKGKRTRAGKHGAPRMHGESGGYGDGHGNGHRNCKWMNEASMKGKEMTAMKIAANRISAKTSIAAIIKRYRARRFRRGFSLFGVLLGLGLAAVVIVGAVGTYNAAREAANRSEALVLLNRIRANIEAAFAGAPSYGNNADLVAALDRRGGIPDSARTIGKDKKVEIRHPFGGLVTVTGGPGGITNRFRIQFADVDNEICAALGDAYAGRSRARAGVISITINGAALTSPVTAAQITTGCDDGDGANDIGFIFG